MNRTLRKKSVRRQERRLKAAYARRIAHPVLAGLELPEDVSGRAARLTILGSSRALVENCRGVEEVGETRMRLRLSGGTLTVEGKGLCLTDVRADAVCICGCLEALRLPGAEDAHD